jgi:hypothetical protein
MRTKRKGRFRQTDEEMELKFEIDFSAWSLDVDDDDDEEDNLYFVKNQNKKVLLI